MSWGNSTSLQSWAGKGRAPIGLMRKPNLPRVTQLRSDRTGLDSNGDTLSHHANPPPSLPRSSPWDHHPHPDLLSQMTWQRWSFSQRSAWLLESTRCARCHLPATITSKNSLIFNMPQNNPIYWSTGLPKSKVVCAKCLLLHSNGIF